MSFTIGVQYRLPNLLILEIFFQILDYLILDRWIDLDCSTVLLDLDLCTSLQKWLKYFFLVIVHTYFHF